MAPKKGNHDPFNPDNVAVWCPECQKDRLVPRGTHLRVCKTCGRTEVFEKPDRKVHGERPYKRLMARQKKKFGATEGIALPQWIVKAPRPPEGDAAAHGAESPAAPAAAPAAAPKPAAEEGEGNLLVKRLMALDLTPDQIGGVLGVIKTTCNRCWNADAGCRCGQGA